MIISQNGTVDLIPEFNRALKPIFCVSQGDANSRMINLTVQNAGTNFSIPEGANVYVVGRKIDNTIFTYECTYSGYIVTFPVADQMAAIDGIVLCELQIIVNDDPLGTANFVYWVEPSPVENGTASESDLNIMSEAVAAVGSMDSLRNYVADAVESMQVISGQTVIDPTLTVYGAAADAQVTGNLMTAVGTMGDGASKAYGGNVYLSTPAGECMPANSAYTITKIGNVFKVNGTLTFANSRVPLTGTDLRMSSGQPSYTARPLWYLDDIPDFIVGHDYIATYIAEGTTTAATPAITMRDKDGTLNRSVNFDTVFTCTIKPQMVCTVLKPGDYTNYRLFVKITDLTVQGGRYYVPNIFESQLATAIPKINTDINSTKTVGTYGTDIESFVFITDVHWAANKQHSPGLIKRIMEQTSVSTVICGGDIINSHAASKEAACAELNDFAHAITEIPCYEYFAVFGNHDDNSNQNSSDIAAQFTKAEQYNLMYSPFANADNVHWIWDDDPTIFTEAVVKNDYYVDHARTRTRYICLDWNNPVSAKRTAWVTGILARNDGFRVIIIYHGFYAGESLTPEHDGWLSVFEPYKNKIVAMFSGHAHVDGVVDCYGDGSTPVIVTSCDTFREDRMTPGTLDEQCFDVAVIDYTNSVIKLTRIGRGSDRTVNFTLS